MNAVFFFLRDAWGQWAIDHAGVESGMHRIGDLRSMLDRGDVHPRTWLRHRWTRRFSLVGEALYANGMATDEEFETWFPNPHFSYSAQ